MRKLVRKRVRRSGNGRQVVADVSAVVVTNAGQRESSGEASAHQRARIVQRDGRTQTWEAVGDEGTGGPGRR